MKLPRGSCAVCGRNIAIGGNGRIYGHTKLDRATFSYDRLISTTCAGSGKLPDKIYAPWSADIVTALNHYQTSSRLMPFTCKFLSDHPPGILTATPDGWICPAPDCDYTQNWAHHFMSTYQV